MTESSFTLEDGTEVIVHGSLCDGLEPEHGHIAADPFGLIEKDARIEAPTIESFLSPFLKFDPAQPRDDRGRWSAGGGSGGSGSGGIPDRVQGGTLYTSDVHAAAAALARGQRVELQQTRQVSTLLGVLRDIVADAKAKGKDAPTYDLCKVSVAGTNLFCAQSKGIPRIEMPQLKGVPLPGSKADALPRDERGEVTLTTQFREHLAARGVAIEDTTEQAAYLKATQDELNGAKVAGISKAYEDGKLADERLFVSRDNYIVDGHHRWASITGVDAANNRLGDEGHSIDVARIDMPIIDLLAESNAFAQEWGIPQAGLSGGFAKAFLFSPFDGPPCIGCDEILKFDPSQPRDKRGRWQRTGALSAAAPLDRDPITASDLSPSALRSTVGASRQVSGEEYGQLAREGRSRLAQLRRSGGKPEWLDRNLDAVADEAHAAAQESWGGATIDVHTGKRATTGYAITIRGSKQQSVSIPENANRETMRSAVREARRRFGKQFQIADVHIGVFHDDDLKRIDIDPVLVVRTPRAVETIGAYTRAVGGAYNFADGNGYWPPHVADGTVVKRVLGSIFSFVLRKSHDDEHGSAARFFAGERPVDRPLWEGEEGDEEVDWLDDIDAELEKAYSPNQPRWPAGHPLGGQWRSDAAMASDVVGERLSPHYERPYTNPSGRGGAPDNPDATRVSSMPEEFKQKLIGNFQKVGLPPHDTQGLDVHDEGQHLVGHMANNLDMLMGRIKNEHPHLVAMGKDWYANAQARIGEHAVESGFDLNTAVGMTAVMSPNSEWGQNIAMAGELMRQMKADRPFVATKADLDYLVEKGKAPKGADARELHAKLKAAGDKGLRLSQLDDPEQAAWLFITEARSKNGGLVSENPTPLGTFGKVAYATGTVNIGKAISIGRGASIDQTLGGHKVRSFYNNLADPYDSRGFGDTTMDTHAASAAQLFRMPMTSRRADLTVWTGASKGSNQQGAYAFYADAYREVARRHDMTPNQAQAVLWIGWQAVRHDYPGVTVTEGAQVRAQGVTQIDVYGPATASIKGRYGIQTGASGVANPPRYANHRSDWQRYRDGTISYDDYLRRIGSER